MVVVQTVLICGSFFLMNLIRGHGYCSEVCLESETDLVVDPMAEDELRSIGNIREAGSSSKDAKGDRDERWLQLGLGGYTTSPELKLDPVPPMTTTTATTTTPRSGLVELNLLPGRSTQHVTELRVPPRPRSTNSISAPLFLQYPRTGLGFPHSEIAWGYRPNPWNPTGASSSSSLVPLAPYYLQPFQQQNIGLAGPSSQVRIIDAPPQRPHPGIWFVLQASENQSKEPFLPQIPKSYLRIKDGRMTVRLLMKYLVNKLSLNNESEIEIRCRGQQLEPLLTLQHVRDNVWRTMDAVTLLSDSSTTQHIMILHYGRIA